MISNSALQNVPPQASWWPDILLITLLAFALYSLFLGAYPLLIPDEGRYSDVVREMLRTGNYITPLYNGIPFLDKPPLYYWIQTLFVHFIGLNEWGLRLWPVTIATIGCIGTYITGRHLFNRRTGWMAAMVLGSSAFYFVMAHVADLDLTVAIFITFSLYCFLLALEKTETQRWYFYSAYVFAALAILTKGLIGIVIPMMVIGLWILFLNRWKLLRRMHIVSGLIIILIICGPWFYLVQQQNHNFFHYFFYVQQFHRYLTHEFNSRHGLWFYPFILLVGTLPWSFFVIAAFIQKIKTTWQDRQHHKKPLFLLLWVIGVTVFFSIPISKSMGYILPVFPPIALLTASHLEKIIRLKEHSFSLIIPLIICLCLYPAIMFGIAHEGTRFGITTSKPLALQLKKRLQPSNTVVFYDYYYQDLALYLDHNVLLAGDFKHEKLKDIWRQDFIEGLKNPNYKHHTLTLKQLHQLWQSKKTVYIFATTDKIDAFKNTAHPPYHLIGHYQKLWLFKQ